MERRAWVVARAGVHHAQVQHAGHQVGQHDHEHRRAHRGVGDAALGRREPQQPGDRVLVRGNQAAQDRAENHRDHGAAFDPAVRRHQPPGRQDFGQDPVLGRRIGRGAKADDAVGEQGIGLGQDQRAAEHLDRVRHQHHAALGKHVGEGAGKGRQQDVRQHEAHLQHRRHPAGKGQRRDQRDAQDEQRAVGQRRKELGPNDGEEGGFHDGGPWLECPYITAFAVLDAAWVRRTSSFRCKCSRNSMLFLY
jgi:hypothetical protein